MRSTTKGRYLRAAGAAVAITLAAVAVAQTQSGESSRFLPHASNRPVDDPETQPTTPPATSEPYPTSTVDPVPEPSCECPWPPSAYALDSVVMTLERTPCFGACPEYTVAVHGDGRVVYEGRRYVRVVGRQEAQIERGRVEDLLDYFYDKQFFALQAEYLEYRRPCISDDGTVEECSEWVSDLPTQIVTFQAGDYFKRVEDYWHAPDGLRELEQAIDEVAGTDRWVLP